MNDDCTKAFFCMLPDDLPESAPEDAEGCELVCEDDEVLIADPRYTASKVSNYLIYDK